MHTYIHKPGADPGFQVRGGAHLKKLRRAEGGAKIVWVFRVKNHDFTPKNHIFSQFLGGGGARRVRPPPLDPPLYTIGIHKIHAYIKEQRQMFPVSSKGNTNMTHKNRNVYASPIQ